MVNFLSLTTVASLGSATSLDFPPWSLMVIATLEEFNDMNSMEVVRCQRSEYEECGSPARSG